VETVHEVSAAGRIDVGLPGLVVDVEGVTGAYFAKGRVRTSNKALYDEEDAARLWRVSSDLVDVHLRIDPGLT
jgi:hypothetical protein